MGQFKDVRDVLTKPETEGQRAERERVEKEEKIRQEKIQNVVVLQWLEAMFYLLGSIAFLFYILGR